jgi:hypothetical protein
MGETCLSASGVASTCRRIARSPMLAASNATFGAAAAHLRQGRRTEVDRSRARAARRSIRWTVGTLRTRWSCRRLDMRNLCEEAESSEQTSAKRCRDRRASFFYARTAPTTAPDCAGRRTFVQFTGAIAAPRRSGAHLMCLLTPCRISEIGDAAMAKPRARCAWMRRHRVSSR